MLVKRDQIDCKNLVLKQLSNNCPVIAPCDTIYGFIGVAPQSDSIIRKIKGRGENKPFLSLIASKDISFLSDQKIPSSILDLWPGPLTLIVNIKSSIQSDFNTKTIAIRYPDNPWLHDIIKRAGGFLYSTSVNRSGYPPMNNIKEIIDEFSQDVNLIVDGGTIKGSPSTILNLTHTPYQILRQGNLQISKELLK